jgi:hypothetical protein
MKRNGMEVDVDMINKVHKLQHENQRLKEIVNQDLVDRLIKENTHLKHELERKTNDEILDKGRVNTGDNNPHEVRLNYLKEKCTIEKSDVGSSYSTNKAITKEKEPRLMSTNTCTKTNDDKSSKNSKRSMFPLIPTSNKSSPSVIL